MKNGCITDDEGTKIWWVNGNIHRTDGPAIIYPEGTKEWRLDGQLHREDGPAYEFHDGTTEYWLNNVRYSKPQYYTVLYKRGIITEEECFLHQI